VGQDEVLTAHERVAGRPFTDPERTIADEAVMGPMLERLRREAPWWTGREVPLERREYEGACRHWIVLPRPDALAGAENLTAVGFFGDLRAGMDHARIYELEEQVVARLGRYAEAGLLCYYDAELEPGVHGNLVLFAGAGVPREWHADVVHADAVALAPIHYRCVRLHRAAIRGRFLGAEQLAVEQTRYFDFSEEPAWTALRRFV